MTGLVASPYAGEINRCATLLLAQATEHPCAQHPLFRKLETEPLSLAQAAGLLRNYDAHATVLRRLLLKAATIMPEEAVGFILENVRNEYGNGDVKGRHQLQLRDLARQAGITDAQFMAVAVQKGVREYVSAVIPLYVPSQIPRGFYRPAVAAGAITATEILALAEFRAMQKAFVPYGLTEHVWFDHVNVEAEHAGESLALALYFVENHNALQSVQFGMAGVLAANCRLYDGFIAAMNAGRL